MVSGFAVGDELYTGNGQGGNQEDVNEAALMHSKLQNQPNQKKKTSNYPHSTKAFLMNS